jgi:hypothetical protein
MRISYALIYLLTLAINHLKVVIIKLIANFNELTIDKTHSF